VNFLQSIFLGGLGGLGTSAMPGLGFSSPGMQMLLGNILGGAFVKGGFQMQAGTAPMMQQLSQVFGGRQQQGGQTFSTWLSNLDRPTFQPDASKSPVEQYHDLHRFARESGSRDGTPVADWTDSKQDLAAVKYLDDLVIKQDDVIVSRLKRAPLLQRMAVAEQEEKFRERRELRAAEGHPVTGREEMRERSLYMEKLYQDGRIGSDLGDANRDLMTMHGCSLQSWANVYLKNGFPPPSDMPVEELQRSPYNPQNLQAQGTRQNSRNADA